MGISLFLFPFSALSYQGTTKHFFSLSYAVSLDDYRIAKLSPQLIQVFSSNLKSITPFACCRCSEIVPQLNTSEMKTLSDENRIVHTFSLNPNYLKLRKRITHIDEVFFLN